MTTPNETTAKVACRTYDPRRMNWHTEQLSPEGMRERRETGYGCITVANATRVPGVTKMMEAAAKANAAGESKVWDHGQFAPEGA